MVSILWEIEVVEYLRRASKTDHAASLEYSEGGNPNRNQSILAKGDGRFIMHLPQ
jgi:hypothetical protein